jgi:hypothetical protein
MATIVGAVFFAVLRLQRWQLSRGAFRILGWGRVCKLRRAPARGRAASKRDSPNASHIVEMIRLILRLTGVKLTS